MRKIIIVGCIIFGLTGNIVTQENESNPTPAQTTGNISGKVMNFNTGEVFSGANVTLKGTTLGGATDSDGQFKIANVPPGNYIVVARFIGFKSTEQGVFIYAGEDKELNLALSELEPILMQAIDVSVLGYGVRNTRSATKTNTPIIDIPQSVQIINKDLYEDQGSYYLTDVLKNVSGLNISSEYNDVMFRGFRSQQAASFKQN